MRTRLQIVGFVVAVLFFGTVTTASAWEVTSPKPYTVRIERAQEDTAGTVLIYGRATQPFASWYNAGSWDNTATAGWALAVSPVFDGNDRSIEFRSSDYGYFFVVTPDGEQSVVAYWAEPDQRVILAGVLTTQPVTVDGTATLDAPVSVAGSMSVDGTLPVDPWTGFPGGGVDGLEFIIACGLFLAGVVLSKTIWGRIDR